MGDSMNVKGFLGALLVALIAAANTTARGGADLTSEPGIGEARLLDLAMRTRAARLAGDNLAWLEYGQRVLRLAPDHPDLLISVARALAANGRLEEAISRLGEAIERGAGFDLSSFPEFKSAAEDPAVKALGARALQNQVAVSPPEVFVALKDTNLRPEGITYDPASRRLFVGSLNGEIWQIDLQGRLQRFVGPGTGLREVLGLKVDPRRRLLWAVTGVFPDLFSTGEPKKEVGVTGVHAYNLDTSARVRECTLDERPKLHGFNDLALASNGDVYVTDSTEGAVYRLPGGECSLERLLQDFAMTSPNGIVLTSDEKRLYVAHIEGISVVDVGTGRRTQLAVPANGAVNSIDGLAFDGPDLLGIQGSPYLARVARIRLDDGGPVVREVLTVSSRPPMGLNQTTGVVVGSHFYTVAGFPDALAPAVQGERFSHVLRATLR